MTLDMYGNPVLPWYAKFGFILGAIIAFIQIPLIISHFLQIENVEQPIRPIVTSLPDAIDIILTSWWIMLWVLILAILIGIISAVIEMYGLPREDEIH